MAGKIRNGYTEVKKYWTNESKTKDKHSCGILFNPGKEHPYWAIANFKSAHFDTLEGAIQFMNADGCTERI